MKHSGWQGLPNSSVIIAPPPSSASPSTPSLLSITTSTTKGPTNLYCLGPTSVPSLALLPFSFLKLPSFLAATCALALVSSLISSLPLLDNSPLPLSDPWYWRKRVRRRWPRSVAGCGNVGVLPGLLPPSVNFVSVSVVDVQDELPLGSIALLRGYSYITTSIYWSWSSPPDPLPSVGLLPLPLPLNWYNVLCAACTYIAGRPLTSPLSICSFWVPTLGNQLDSLISIGMVVLVGQPLELPDDFLHPGCDL